MPWQTKGRRIAQLDAPCAQGLAERWHGHALRLPLDDPSPEVREAMMAGENPRDIAEYLSQVSPNNEKFAKDYWADALLY